MTILPQDPTRKPDSPDDYCHCPAKFAPHRHLGPVTNGPDASIVQAIIGLPMRLKAHRAACDVSLREAAKRIGVSYATLHRIESGEDYVVSNLLAISAYLDEVRTR